MADAEALIRYARALKNDRRRRMRQELRTQVGAALRISRDQREQLDCLENRDLFVVFKPDGSLGRDHFTDQQPLLRQSVVAACAALETYVADKVMESVGDALRADPIPARMKDIGLTVGQWSEIERTYKRRGWGVRDIVEDHIREKSSTAPSSIGIVLSMIGVRGWLKKVDRVRSVDTTGTELDEITERRNLIAHTADRRGQGRASVSPEEVEGQLVTIREVANALERVLDEHTL